MQNNNVRLKLWCIRRFYCKLVAHLGSHIGWGLHILEIWPGPPSKFRPIFFHFNNILFFWTFGRDQSWISFLFLFLKKIIVVWFVYLLKLNFRKLVRFKKVNRSTFLNPLFIIKDFQNYDDFKHVFVSF